MRPSDAQKSGLQKPGNSTESLTETTMFEYADSPPEFIRRQNVAERKKGALRQHPLVFGLVIGLMLAAGLLTSSILEPKESEEKTEPSVSAVEGSSNLGGSIEQTVVEQAAVEQIEKVVEQDQQLDVEPKQATTPLTTVSRAIEPLFPAPNSKMPKRVLVRQGDTWSSILSRFDVPMAEARLLQQSLRNLARRHASLRSVLPQGAELSLFFDSNRQLQRVELKERLGEYAVFTKSANAKEYIGSIEQTPRIIREFAAFGVIESSLAKASAAIGLSYEAIDEFVDLFGSRIDFYRDLRKGDTFTLIFQHEFLEDGTPLETVRVLAASLFVRNEEYVAVRFQGENGKAHYFDGSGKVLGNSFLRYPAKFSRISSPFNKRRFHPVLKRRIPHNGVDFAAPVGTPVRATADGTITFAGRKGPAGIMVKIAHGRRYATAYLHLSKIASGIRRGVRVRRGQVIGAVGMTGRATGPHLHYSFYDKGRYVDPMKVKLPVIDDLAKGNQIPTSYLARAKETLAHYRAILSQSGGATQEVVAAKKN